MKRLNYFFIIIGIIISIFSLICSDNIWDFVNVVLPYPLLVFSIRKVKENKKINLLTFVNIWITCYNFLFALILFSDEISIFERSEHMFMQYGIPFVIVRMIQSMKSQDSKNR